jgi:hypothetical protein
MGVAHAVASADSELSESIMGSLPVRRHHASGNGDFDAPEQSIAGLVSFAVPDLSGNRRHNWSFRNKCVRPQTPEENWGMTRHAPQSCLTQQQPVPQPPPQQPSSQLLSRGSLLNMDISSYTEPCRMQETQYIDAHQYKLY